MDRNYDVIASDQGAPIKMWTRGVAVEDAAREQLRRTAEMPFIFKHLAVMPDVHVGIGSTVAGSATGCGRALACTAARLALR